MKTYGASGARPKTGKQKAVKGKPSQRPSASKRTVILFVVAFVVVAAAVAVSVFPSLFSRTTATIPDDLIGVWKTTAPNYADRSFEMSRTTVLFRTGPGDADFTFHEVKGLEREENGQVTSYTLTYADGLKFSFTYEKVADVIRFVNQPEFFWSRDGETPSTIAAVAAVAAQVPDSGAEQPAQAAAAEVEPGEPDDSQTAGETELIREVFSYRGAGRDPFQSLLTTADIRPFLRDLRIAGITYDPRYPARSVAVLRDTVANKAYSVRVGDELGRMRVASIVPGEVLLIVAEFGSERQVVLRQRGKQTL
jgi:hypothetical protein